MDPFFFFILVIFLYLALRFFLAPTIAPNKAIELLKEGATLIDVRTEGEYSDSHLEEALNIPHFRIAQEIGKYVEDKDQPVLLYCLSGTRSATATRALKRIGYNNVFNLGTHFKAQRIYTKYRAEAE